MTDVLLFHHVQGLTEGVEAFADQLRAAGHEVTAPDLFGGAIFATIDEGMAHVRNVGPENITAAGAEVADALPARIVYAGFSLGAMMAHEFAQTRPRALGALLYHHGDVPVDAFADTWPIGVDVQIHVAEQDEFYEPDVVEEFVQVAGANAEARLFLYPGSAHLFTDSSLPEFEPDSAALVMQRTLDFLNRHSSDQT
jgi:dienelactone hydrolase